MLGIKRALGAIMTLSALALAMPASAATPLSIVVPYGAGGTTDSFARVLAEGMSRELKRPVIVENKPGANGLIGASYVARAKPDGNTVLLGGTGPVSLNVMLRPTPPFTFDSFDSVAMLFEGPLTITVPGTMGVNTLDEFVDYAKKRDEPIRYGTLGPGSVTDLYGYLLAKAFDVQILAVPYRDTGGALLDLLAGRGDLTTATPTALLEHQKTGALRILALTTTERDPAVADVPTVTELGHPELQASYWGALHAPKGTPPEMVKAMSDAAIKTVQSDKFRELIRRNGQVEKAGGPDALDAQLQHDREHWGRIIKENNIVLE